MVTGFVSAINENYRSKFSTNSIETNVEEVSGDLVFVIFDNGSSIETSNSLFCFKTFTTSFENKNGSQLSQLRYQQVQSFFPRLQC